MTRRVFFKLLSAMVLVLLLGALMLDVSQQHILQYSLQRQLQKDLTGKARLLALRVDFNDPSTLADAARKEARVAGARVTILNASGAVLAESEPQSGSGNNLAATRANAAEAHAVLTGHRDSEMHVAGDVMYVAIPAGSYVVRLAYPMNDVRETLRVARHSLWLATLLAMLLATLVAALVAHAVARRLARIVEFANRIASGDFTARIEETSGDEIAVVAKALDATAGRLEQSFRALQDSRKELEAVLDSMEEAVIAVDAQSRIHWTNKVMERFAGVSLRTGSALVQTVRDPDLLVCVEQALRERVVTKGRARSVLSGKIFEISVAPMPGGSAVVVLHDVSEIERVEKTRRDFIANVSHELRTPLTSITGYAETLMEDDSQLSAQAKDFLGIIRKNASRMNRLTEDLLTLARIESGEYKLRRQSVAASVLVEEAIALFSGALLATDVRLESGELTQERVFADTDAVLQALSNLLENAVKYGGVGKRIVIGARAIPGTVEFSVQDFGAGIPSEHLDRIFERFYRVDKGRTKDAGGTGLGLSIAKHIILAHGGSLRVESELNRGSTFFFTIPLATEDGSAGPIPDLSPADAGAA